MIDIDERAERAGEAVRDLARSVVAQMPHPAEDRGGVPHGRLVAGVGAAMVAAAAVAVVLSGDARMPVIDGGPDPAAPVAVDGVLPVPEVGEVLAAYLEDGAPVFVTRPTDGGALVLDAASPHTGSGPSGKLVAYCPSSGWFEDLYHGSKFTVHGDWMGGPAPTGLRAYPTGAATDGSTVEVTGTAGEAPAREDRRGEPYEPRGASCAPDEPGSSDVVVAHRPDHPVPVVSGSAIPADRWIWATLVLGGEPGSVVACDTDGACPPDAPTIVADVNQPDGTLIERTPAVHLARAQPDGTVELLRPAHPDDHRARPATGAEPLLGIPDRGDVSATYLADGMPVFVTHTGEGDLHVLDPTSPTVPADLVGWCRSTGRFHDQVTSFGPDGEPTAGPATTSLGTYPIELVELGETRAIRVAGDPVVQLVPHREASPDGGGACESGDWVAHRPSDDTFVHQAGTHVNHERWSWFRLTIEAVGDDLYLCSLGSHVPACGEPSPTQTVCPDTAPDGSPEGCHPLRDPEVATPGIGPTDEPVLLLVRADPTGATAEVRRPLEDAAATVSSDGCEPVLSASVRGTTGTFGSAAEAARSVTALPADGRLVELSGDGQHAIFGWLVDDELSYVIDTARADDGWTVGSYERCQTEDRGSPADGRAWVDDDEKEAWDAEHGPGIWIVGYFFPPDFEHDSFDDVQLVRRWQRLTTDGRDRDRAGLLAESLAALPDAMPEEADSSWLPYTGGAERSLELASVHLDADEITLDFSELEAVAPGSTAGVAMGLQFDAIVSHYYPETATICVLVDGEASEWLHDTMTCPSRQ